MDWLHQAQTARQNHARRSQMKKLLVLSGFLDQKFAGNLKEVGQIVPDSVRILLCLQKRQNLVLSGSIWPASFNFPSNFWSRKPDRTSNFLSGSVWHDFVWLSGPWCSQGITKTLLFCTDYMQFNFLPCIFYREIAAMLYCSFKEIHRVSEMV